MGKGGCSHCTRCTTKHTIDCRVKMIVLLGEVGGVEEYRIVDALKVRIR